MVQLKITTFYFDTIVDKPVMPKNNLYSLMSVCGSCPFLDETAGVGKRIWILEVGKPEFKSHFCDLFVV